MNSTNIHNTIIAVFQALGHRWAFQPGLAPLTGRDSDLAIIEAANVAANADAPAWGLDTSNFVAEELGNGWVYISPNSRIKIMVGEHSGVFVRTQSRKVGDWSFGIDSKGEARLLEAPTCMGIDHVFRPNQQWQHGQTKLAKLAVSLGLFQWDGEFVVDQEILIQELRLELQEEQDRLRQAYDWLREAQLELVKAKHEIWRLDPNHELAQEVMDMPGSTFLAMFQASVGPVVVEDEA